MAAKALRNKVASLNNPTAEAGDGTSKSYELISYIDAPLRISDILSGPPLLPGEDELAYTAIMKWFADSFSPEDLIEAIWVKDIADAHWEAERNRRVRAAYLNMMWRTKAIALLATKLTPNPGNPNDSRQRAELMIDEHLSSNLGPDQFGTMLSTYGIKYKLIMAQVHSEAFPTLEMFDRIIETATKTRDRLVRQLEKRRSGKNSQRKMKTVGPGAHGDNHAGG